MQAEVRVVDVESTFHDPEEISDQFNFCTVSLAIPRPDDVIVSAGGNQGLLQLQIVDSERTFIFDVRGSGGIGAEKTYSTVETIRN
jgi:hypothetical protein